MLSPDLKIQFLKKWGAVLRDGLLGVMGIVSLPLAGYLAFTDRLPAAGVLVTAGLFMVLLSQLSRFKSIKGLGIDAQLHELGEKLDEADRLFTHLREIVGLTADVSFQVLGKVGNQASAFSRKEAIEIADAFRRQLKSLGEDDSAIEQHMLPWHQSNLRELMRSVHERIGDFIQLQIQETSNENRQLPLDTPADDERRLAILAKETVNTALLVANMELWDKDVFAYVAAIETIILESRCGNEAVRRLLIADLKTGLDNAKHYATKFDFKNRAVWINSQPTLFLKGM